MDDLFAAAAEAVATAGDSGLTVAAAARAAVAVTATAGDVHPPPVDGRLHAWLATAFANRPAEWAVYQCTAAGAGAGGEMASPAPAGVDPADFVVIATDAVQLAALGHHPAEHYPLTTHGRRCLATIGAARRAGVLQSDLAGHLGLTPAVLHHHLMGLLAGDLVQRRRLRYRAAPLGRAGVPACGSTSLPYTSRITLPRWSTGGADGDGEDDDEVEELLEAGSRDCGGGVDRSSAAAAASAGDVGDVAFADGPGNSRLAPPWSAAADRQRNAASLTQRVAAVLSALTAAGGEDAPLGRLSQRDLKLQLIPDAARDPELPPKPFETLRHRVWRAVRTALLRGGLVTEEVARAKMPNGRIVQTLCLCLTPPTAMALKGLPLATPHPLLLPVSAGGAFGGGDSEGWGGGASGESGPVATGDGDGDGGPVRLGAFLVEVSPATQVRAIFAASGVRGASVPDVRDVMGALLGRRLLTRIVEAVADSTGTTMVREHSGKALHKRYVLPHAGAGGGGVPAADTAYLAPLFAAPPPVGAGGQKGPPVGAAGVTAGLGAVTTYTPVSAVVAAAPSTVAVASGTPAASAVPAAAASAVATMTRGDDSVANGARSVVARTSPLAPADTVVATPTSATPHTPDAAKAVAAARYAAALASAQASVVASPPGATLSITALTRRALLRSLLAERKALVREMLGRLIADAEGAPFSRMDCKVVTRLVDALVAAGEAEEVTLPRERILSLRPGKSGGGGGGGEAVASASDGEGGGGSGGATPSAVPAGAEASPTSPRTTPASTYRVAGMVRLLVLPGLPTSSPEVRAALTAQLPGMAQSPMAIGLADRRRRFGLNTPTVGSEALLAQKGAVPLPPRNRKRGRPAMASFPLAPITPAPTGAAGAAGAAGGDAAGKDSPVLATLHPRKGVLLARQSMLALMYARHYGLVGGGMVRARKLHLELLRLYVWEPTPGLVALPADEAAAAATAAAADVLSAGAAVMAKAGSTAEDGRTAAAGDKRGSVLSGEGGAAVLPPAGAPGEPQAGLVVGDSAACNGTGAGSSTARAAARPVWAATMPTFGGMLTPPTVPPRPLPTFSITEALEAMPLGALAGALGIYGDIGALDVFTAGTLVRDLPLTTRHVVLRARPFTEQTRRTMGLLRRLGLVSLTSDGKRWRLQRKGVADHPTFSGGRCLPPAAPPVGTGAAAAAASAAAAAAASPQPSPLPPAVWFENEATTMNFWTGLRSIVFSFVRDGGRAAAKADAPPPVAAAATPVAPTGGASAAGGGGDGDSSGDGGGGVSGGRRLVARASSTARRDAVPEMYTLRNWNEDIRERVFNAATAVSLEREFARLAESPAVSLSGEGAAVAATAGRPAADGPPAAAAATLPTATAAPAERRRRKATGWARLLSVLELYEAATRLKVPPMTAWCYYVYRQAHVMPLRVRKLVLSSVPLVNATCRRGRRTEPSRKGSNDSGDGPTLDDVGGRRRRRRGSVPDDEEEAVSTGGSGADDDRDGGGAASPPRRPRRRRRVDRDGAPAVAGDDPADDADFAALMDPFGVVPVPDGGRAGTGAARRRRRRQREARPSCGSSSTDAGGDDADYAPDANFRAVGGVTTRSHRMATPRHRALPSSPCSSGRTEVRAAAAGAGYPRRSRKRAAPEGPADGSVDVAGRQRRRRRRLPLDGATAAARSAGASLGGRRPPLRFSGRSGRSGGRGDVLSDADAAVTAAAGADPDSTAVPTRRRRRRRVPWPPADEMRLLAVVALARGLERIALTRARRRLPSMFPASRRGVGSGTGAERGVEGWRSSVRPVPPPSVDVVVPPPVGAVVPMTGVTPAAAAAAAEVANATPLSARLPPSATLPPSASLPSATLPPLPCAGGGAGAPVSLDLPPPSSPSAVPYSPLSGGAKAPASAARGVSFVTSLLRAPPPEAATPTAAGAASFAPENATASLAPEGAAVAAIAPPAASVADVALSEAQAAAEAALSAAMAGVENEDAAVAAVAPTPRPLQSPGAAASGGSDTSGGLSLDEIGEGCSGDEEEAPEEGRGTDAAPAGVATAVTAIPPAGATTEPTALSESDSAGEARLYWDAAGEFGPGSTGGVASGCQRYLISWDDIARAVGASMRAVRNRAAMLTLRPDVQEVFAGVVALVVDYYTGGSAPPVPLTDAGLPALHRMPLRIGGRGGAGAEVDLVARFWEKLYGGVPPEEVAAARAAGAASVGGGTGRWRGGSAGRAAQQALRSRGGGGRGVGDRGGRSLGGSDDGRSPAPGWPSVSPTAGGWSASPASRSGRGGWSIAGSTPHWAAGAAGGGGGGSRRVETVLDFSDARTGGRTPAASAVTAADAADAYVGGGGGDGSECLPPSALIATVGRLVQEGVKAVVRSPVGVYEPAAGRGLLLSLEAAGAAAAAAADAVAADGGGRGGARSDGALKAAFLALRGRGVIVRRARDGSGRDWSLGRVVSQALSDRAMPRAFFDAAGSVRRQVASLGKREARECEGASDAHAADAGAADTHATLPDVSAAVAAAAGGAQPAQAAAPAPLPILNDTFWAADGASPSALAVAFQLACVDRTVVLAPLAAGEDAEAAAAAAATAASPPAAPAAAMTAPTAPIAPTAVAAAVAPAAAVTRGGVEEVIGVPPPVLPSRLSSADGGEDMPLPIGGARGDGESDVRSRPAAAAGEEEPPAAVAGAATAAATHTSGVANGVLTPAQAAGGEATASLPLPAPSLATAADSPSAAGPRPPLATPEWHRDYPSVEAVTKRLVAEEDAAWAALLVAASGDGRHHVALRALRAALAAAGVGGVRGHELLATLRDVELPAADGSAVPLTPPAALTPTDVVAAVRAARAAGAVHRYELNDDTGAFVTGGGALFVARATTAAFRVYPYRVVRAPQPSSLSSSRRSSRVVQFNHGAGVPLAPLLALDGTPDEELTAALRCRLLTVLMRSPGASQAVVLAAVRRSDVPGRAVLSQLATLERARRVRRTCVAGLPPRAGALSAALGGVGDRGAARRALAARLAAPLGGAVSVPPPSLADLEDDVPEISGLGRELVTHYWVTAKAVDAVPLSTG